MNNWKETTLGEIAKNVSRRFDFSNKEKVIFVNTGDVQEGKFLHKNYLKSEGLPGQAKKALKNGDILLSEIRPANGRYALVDFEANDYVVSTKFMVICGNELVDPRFLYLFLTSRQTLQEFQVIAESRSGTFPQITFDSIANFPILLPSLPEQKQIASVLSSLDDKIELLRAENVTLEKIAQGIFKEWFVNFNFPDATGKTIDSELGKIPEGWKVFELKDLVSHLKPGTNYQPKRLVEGIPFVNGRNVQDGFLDLTNVTYISDEEYQRVHKSWKPEENDLLITRIGTLGHVGIVRKSDLPIAVHYNIIVIKQSILSHQFLYFLLNSEKFQEQYHMNKKQAVQEFVTIEAVEKIKLAFPKDINLAKEFFLVFDDLFDKVKNNYEQIQALSRLRDTLLPKLMSGEITVE